ncbi:hypothetical protein EV363DRAFT_1585801 [Boletus edulis]|nr:hypothetical protein EV363DRAFT_1585801 [Boletus edulis]
MSANLVAALEGYYLSNYSTVAIITAVAYDYALTFPIEVKYIWKRRWTWVSTTFLFVRYAGLLSIITTSLNESGFVPGPLWVSKVVTYLMRWSTISFTVAADLVMIFRAYALYNQSRTILGVLLFIYAAEIVVSTISAVIYSWPESTLVAISPAPYPPVCMLKYTSISWGRFSPIPLVVLQGLMCLLVIYHFLEQSYQTYIATKQWKLNQYIHLIVHQGILYFIINFLYVIIIKDLFTIPMAPTVQAILATILDILIYTLNPRFILSIRELHAHALHGQWVDAGFGMSLDQGVSLITSVHFAPPNTVEEVEEVPMGIVTRQKYIDVYD